MTTPLSLYARPVHQQENTVTHVESAYLIGTETGTSDEWQCARKDLAVMQTMHTFMKHEVEALKLKLGKYQNKLSSIDCCDAVQEVIDDLDNTHEMIGSALGVAERELRMAD